MKSKKRKIVSKLSILYKPHTRRKTKENLWEIWFHLYDTNAKNIISNPLGHTFEIDPQHKSIEINKEYCYFSNKDFEKIMKHLKRCIDFYFKKK